MDIDFLKEIYKNELDRSVQFRTAVTMPLGLLTVLGGLLGTMVMGFSYVPGAPTTIFVCLIAVDVALFTMVAWYLIKAIYGNSVGGFSYSHLPTAGQLLSYWKGLEDYYHGATQDQIDATNEIKYDFDEFLVSRLVEAADYNSEVNALKSQSRHGAIRYLIVLLLATAATGAVYIYEAKFKGKTVVPEISGTSQQTKGAEEDGKGQPQPTSKASSKTSAASKSADQGGAGETPDSTSGTADQGR